MIEKKYELYIHQSFLAKPIIEGGPTYAPVPPMISLTCVIHILSSKFELDKSKLQASITRWLEGKKIQAIDFKGQQWISFQQARYLWAYWSLIMKGIEHLTDQLREAVTNILHQILEPIVLDRRNLGNAQYEDRTLKAVCITPS